MLSSQNHNDITHQIVAKGLLPPDYNKLMECLNKSGENDFTRYGKRNNCYLKLNRNANGSEVLIVGEWSTGNKISICLTKSNQSISLEQLAVNRAAQEEAKYRSQEETARKLEQLTFTFGLLPYCTPIDSQYLINKGIADICSQPLLDRVRFDYNSNRLVYGIRNSIGNLQTTQGIDSKGNKYLAAIPDGKRGNFHVIIKHGYTLAACKVIFVAEGYSTAASVYLSMASAYPTAPYAVIVAVDCGNIEPVLLNLWQKLGNYNLVGIADNDTHKDDKPRTANPGVDTWQSIIAKYPDKHIGLFIPEDFKQLNPNKSFDANDMMMLYSRSILASEIMTQCRLCIQYDINSLSDIKYFKE